MRTEDVLAAAGTGLWRWDHATGLVTLDATAAGLFGLPERYTTIGEATVRARVHVEDYIELYRVATLSAAEERIGESRLRVIAPDGTDACTLRARVRAHGDGDDFAMSGTLMEVPPSTAVAAPLGRDWRLSREAFLLDAGRALAEARTTGEVLRVAAGLALPGFSPDGLIVFGVEAGELTVVGHHGYSISATPQRRQAARGFAPTLDSPYPAAEAIRTGRAVYVPGPAEYQRRFPEAWPYVKEFGRCAWAYLPLIVGGRTIGAWMASFPEPVSFSPDERSVLTTVARMLAQALARTHVFETERELSADLQHTMAPAANPDIPGAQLIARYVPTGGGLQIGGDWYDVIPLPSDRVALVIGDVQGHDVRAAAIMAQLRIALRAYAAEGHRPDTVLSRASRFLSGMPLSGDARFATCLYLEADPRTGTLDVARAGHPDPAVRLGDGTPVQRPTVGGPPLGIVPDWSYPTTRITLQRDETLLMFTDGLLETGGHTLDTGWARLAGILRGEPADDLEKLADRLIEGVHGPPSHSHTGPLTDRREDDIALLLFSLQRPEAPERRLVVTVDQAAPGSIAEARHQFAELLHDWADADQTDGAVLMLSEMLTNVLVHTDTDARLTVEITGPSGGRRLRVEVADGSDDLPRRREPGEMASSGRGLLLMENLADAWGVDPRGDGKATWFELQERLSQPG
ncbi:SpoIIE family protein phosphatase [Streptomyces spiramenti]|uniref:SpoIIE family protein phosphatase n=1 Tax=Streptomyces spiramenti TaxID=2720606 RepID=A0ABX1ADP0_9ACTN|nr:SpoIIE family protein phosphatase [Streptomyces spiramenti]NJP65332.1 SpoIIE family protein phosphatase [Streptomyces spiramenti]